MSNDSDKSNHSLLIGLVAVLWIGISLAGYYYTHKPFNIDLLTETLIVLWRLIVVAGIISISGGLGRTRGKLWRKSAPSIPKVFRKIPSPC